jgi:predicted Zn finger-like uncharacterized protein
MRVSCECCGQAYQVDPAKIPVQGKQVRCKTCGGVFTLMPPGTDGWPPGPSTYQEGWSVRIQGLEESGLSLETLKARIRSGEVGEEDEVLPPRASKWLAAGGVPLLGRHFQLRRRSPEAPGPAPTPPPPRPQSTPPPSSQWEGTAAAPPPPEPAAPAAPVVPAGGPGGRTVCKNHPDREAGFACANCGVYYCLECREIKEIQRVRLSMCPACHGPMEEVTQPRNIKPFWQDLGRIFTYPFHVKGRITFFVFVALSVLAEFASMVPFGGAAALVLRGFLIAYLLNMIGESSRGGEHPPDFPEFNEIFGDIILPVIRWFLATAVSFGIWLGLVVLAVYTAPHALRAPLIVVGGGLGILIGMVYYPMVLAILGIWKSLFPSINPVVIFRLIGRIKKEYGIFLAFWYGIWTGNFIIGVVASMVPLGVFVAAAIQAYFSIVLLHMLGRMCYQCDDKLSWA